MLPEDAETKSRNKEKPYWTIGVSFLAFLFVTAASFLFMMNQTLHSRAMQGGNGIFLIILIPLYGVIASIIGAVAAATVSLLIRAIKIKSAFSIFESLVAGGFFTGLLYLLYHANYYL